MLKLHSIKTVLKYIRRLVCIRCKRFTNNSINSEKLIVLGNGPSLNDDIEAILKYCIECEILVVNTFAYSDYFEQLKPKYYVIADPGYWIPEASIEAIQNRDLFFKSIHDKLSWNMMVLIPQDARGSIFANELMRNEFITVMFINNNTKKPFPFCNKYELLENNVISFPFQNVLIMALYSALYLNFKNIYFFGADHDWFRDLEVHDDNMTYIVERHFYEDNQHKYHRYNKSDGSCFSVAELFNAWALVFNTYRQISEFSQYKHANVYNASSRSFIDIFERKKPWDKI